MSPVSHLRLPAVPRWSVSLVAILVTSLVFAGCTDEPASDRFVATASNGALYQGWDYAAETRESVSARIQIDVNEATNTGNVSVQATVQEKQILVNLTRFTHNADDFHSGGIAANFDEHGDSGVGNTLLPRMHLLLATWGPGTILVDGNETVDPYTGSTTWDAHLMVTNTGVRSDADGRVTTGDGQALYDPNTPEDARIGEDHEVHLVLSSTYPNGTVAPFNATFDESVDAGNPAAPTSTETTFDVALGLGRITVAIDLGQETGEIGPYTWQLIAPDGTVADQDTIRRIAPDARSQGTLDTTNLQVGTWTVRGSTSGTAGTYSLDVEVEHPPLPMWYFVWEQVDIERHVQ